MSEIAAPGAWADLSRPPLREAPLRAALVEGPAACWRALEVVAETGSTNADLLARAAAGEAPGLVLIADHQSAGRGRLTRSWVAPPRAALAMSVLLAPTPEQEHWGWLPLLAGVAMARALTGVAGLPARLKWPNDVLVPENGRRDGDLRKVCGILAEAITTPAGPRVVLGAGLNVSQSAEELPVPTAISLRQAGAATIDRDPLARAYLRELAALLRAWQDAGGDARASGLAAAYREACHTIGAQVQVHLPGREPLIGIADGVDDAGHLLVRDPDGVEHRLAAGDVEHVRPAG